jgi:hypothetical protein
MPIKWNHRLNTSQGNAMNIKAIAAAAATIIATTAWAGETKDAKCGAGACGKKETTTKDGSCSKKDKDASCGKKDKEASCSKKDAGCGKKDKEASCSKK